MNRGEAITYFDFLVLIVVELSGNLRRCRTPDIELRRFLRLLVSARRQIRQWLRVPQTHLGPEWNGPAAEYAFANVAGVTRDKK